MPASFTEGYEAVKQLKAWLDGTPDWQEQVFIPAQSADADFDYISWKNQGEGIEADWDLS